MKKRNMILAGTLAAALSMSLAVPAMAQEDPVPAEIDPSEILEALLGEDGSVKDLIPNEEEIGQALGTISEQLQDEDSSLNQGIDFILGMVQNEDGSIDWDKLGENLSGLSEALAGTEEGEDAIDLDAYMARYDLIDAAMKEYVLETNAESFEQGDVQLVSEIVAHMDDIDQAEIKVLGEFTQQNFIIEDDEMHLCGASSVPMLLTLTEDADGNITVTDAEEAEDGEGWSDSVTAMCEEVGIERGDYDAMMNVGQTNDIQAITQYLDEHPEITGAEYMGEIRSNEELHAIVDAYMEELFGDK